MSLGSGNAAVPTGATQQSQNSGGSPSSVTATTHLVFQRYRKCRILLDEQEWVTVGRETNNSDGETNLTNNDSSHHHHCGLLVYVSFAVGATRASVQNAAHTILHLPLLTTGLWGDGTSEQQSVMDMAASYASSQTKGAKSLLSTSLILCPQANLIGKLKGRAQMQYRGQIDKQDGRQLFHYLASCLIGMLLERQCQVRHEAGGDTTAVLPQSYRSWKLHEEREQQQLAWQTLQQQRQQAQPPASTKPQDMFRHQTHLYSAWDSETGLPTHSSVTGEPITKSALKKLKKQHDAHAKRHEKWQKQQQQQHETSPSEENKEEDAHREKGDNNAIHDATNKDTKEDTTSDTQRQIDHDKSWWNELDPGFCHVVVGSFGKRQGLEVSSDMGPFCHVVQV